MASAISGSSESSRVRLSANATILRVECLDVVVLPVLTDIPLNTGRHPPPCHPPGNSTRASTGRPARSVVRR